MSKPIHVAWDYQACDIALRDTVGPRLAEQARVKTTKTLCGATKHTEDTRGLDGLCDVTCVSCLQVVAREGRARTPKGMHTRMKNRIEQARKYNR